MGAPRQVKNVKSVKMSKLQKKSKSQLSQKHHPGVATPRIFAEVSDLQFRTLPTLDRKMQQRPTFGHCCCKAPMGRTRLQTPARVRLLHRQPHLHPRERHLPGSPWAGGPREPLGDLNLCFSLKDTRTLYIPKGPGTRGPPKAYEFIWSGAWRPGLHLQFCTERHR